MACRKAWVVVVLPWLVGCAGDAPPVDPSQIAPREDRGSDPSAGPDSGRGVPGDAAGEPLGAGLCAPCTASAACGGKADDCVEYAGGTFCGTDCTSSGCSAGYRCRQVRSVEGDRARQCVYIGDTCQAAGSSDGSMRDAAARDRGTADAGADVARP